MRGNSFGKLFSLTSFGESHGKAMGVVIDGVPGGLDFSYEGLLKELKRRAPGHIAGTTTRRENDQPIILSGIFNNKTLGTPIAMIVENTNQRSQDYDSLQKECRPGHADETTLMKYGLRDHRGGGRSSGRETLSRVIAGYFASLILPSFLEVKAYIKKLGPFEFQDEIETYWNKNWGEYSFPESEKNEEIKNYLLSLKKAGNSIGGIVGIEIKNPPPALGEPCFDKLKADFSKALLSIGGVVAFSYGKGFEFSHLSGQQASLERQNFGGIEGGISNGQNISLEIIVKPTSTVGEKAKEGRHDPCIIPRAIVVYESMVKIVLADHYLRQKAYQIF